MRNLKSSTSLLAGILALGISAYGLSAATAKDNDLKTGKTFQEKTDKVVDHYRRLLSNKAATEKRLFKHRAGLERAEKRLKTLDREIRAYYKKYAERLV